MSTKKTNAARILDALEIEYSLLSYAVDESDLSAPAVAQKIGLEAAQTFKTLVAKGDKTGIVMACLPGDAELDLKALALASGNKRVELVPLKEVLPLTGYIRGGVSPLGAKKPYPVFLDELAQVFEKIAVSAGQRGLQLFLAPEDLQRATGAVWARLS
ncbi:Cys-tRNA(Pro) deacylase [bacterium (Candidatus Blackallbacteria) CG17_big_fil_post_rev_8_21_14_2_50_48_46]|uniref:Cys-tRNA(Pro)/Cys-tRNA(Cys) deacylase n=1 Tax=bacterium (Candidatus Blackallbacteria) CG17_big_fil_post_rev_8_21_14_2_50_48_46 TaxID=2014261 RepID=A0A2M7G4J0_9BACT|nr:MAG: Cys-tRNA(Pro) deacylase [bacterium (Candidatus Blackallbacteria) CG18_big_fil_WC_8_21_14_2_50_49_26]PIW16454.1 MAG: Cys-tRNA(Pro) deacylase [bacterium (Candidatus Blackallbacteria) CG17_big_fil_post_rev_8_21_14_2_50_48_46]PIW45962.1 MAG: Cys-tRNA(Pro) deacylase [bacterium (Candidatus Blackallbacteria) CG13_big_fil_rev_8_21_14_2_50_49_14]